MEVEREGGNEKAGASFFFFFKVSQEVRAPAPEVCWIDNNGLARGGRTKWGGLIEIDDRPGV